MIWPFGFTAQLEMTELLLVDGAGQPIAREGDFIEAGGGTDAQGVLVICPADSIRVEQQIS